MATFCGSDGSALASFVLRSEHEYASKQGLGKHSRSDIEDESPQPPEKLRQTSAALDLTPLLTSFSTLGIPFPSDDEGLAD